MIPSFHTDDVATMLLLTLLVTTNEKAKRKKKDKLKRVKDLSCWRSRHRNMLATRKAMTNTVPPLPLVAQHGDDLLNFLLTASLKTVFLHGWSWLC